MGQGTGKERSGGLQRSALNVSHDKGCGTGLVEVGVTEHGIGMGELETEGEGEEPKRVRHSLELTRASKVYLHECRVLNTLVR